MDAETSARAVLEGNEWRLLEDRLRLIAILTKPMRKSLDSFCERERVDRGREMERDNFLQYGR